MEFQTSSAQDKNLNASKYRFYFATRYAYIIGGFAHLTFIPIFYFLDISVLVIYNLFSILVFVGAYALNERGFHATSTIIAAVEIMTHAILAMYFIGWGTGFFYYVLSIIPLVFSNPTTSNIQKIFISILLSIFFLSLKYFSNIHAPIVSLDIDVINNLYFMNSFFIIAGISAIVYYFNLASNITEEKTNKERNKADIANQAKSAFLANMSHELRTPLNAIIGYGEMLKDDAEKKGSIQDAKDLNKITNAGSHLLTLIDSILDLTKIEAGKTVFEYQMVNINMIINDVTSTINSMVVKNNNSLIINCDENIKEICTDETRTKQILLNLLSNACKFTKNGTIELTVYEENKNNNQYLYLKISDTGIGIQKDKIESLFQPFVQADISTTRLYGGTGLGLTIIKHFITQMNGAINVESIINEGTTFTIRLPINREQCKNN